MRRSIVKVTASMDFGRWNKTKHMPSSMNSLEISGNMPYTFL
jgi:hypothetical protein